MSDSTVAGTVRVGGSAGVPPLQAASASTPTSTNPVHAARSGTLAMYAPAPRPAPLLDTLRPDLRWSDVTRRWSLRRPGPAFRGLRRPGGSWPGGRAALSSSAVRCPREPPSCSGPRARPGCRARLPSAPPRSSRRHAPRTSGSAGMVNGSWPSPTHVAASRSWSGRSSRAPSSSPPTPTPLLPAGFAADAARMDGDRRYVSLVPTQLHRLLQARGGKDGEAALAALRSFDAILLGGAAAAPRSRAGARAARPGRDDLRDDGDLRGCVYDGVALAGVQVRVVEGASGQALPGAAGVVEIGGAVLATGYLGDEALTAAAFRIDPDGSRWLRTSDLGSSPGRCAHDPGEGRRRARHGRVNVAPPLSRRSSQAWRASARSAWSASPTPSGGSVSSRS
ncbi:hypothetical protein NKG05_06215 [Oerskovia sp. M15]